MNGPERIIFVSTMDSAPWGGSEELWSRTALELAAQGLAVSASVVAWSSLHPRIAQLQRHAVELWLRPRWYSPKRQPARWLLAHHRGPVVREVGRLLAARPSALVVLSSGSIFPPIELVELCVARHVPFVMIGQCNWEGDSFRDATAARYRAALTSSLRCFFVSEGNWRLAEKQIGGLITNAEVVRNPFNVAYAAPAPWPGRGQNDEIFFACVGTLWWPKKGQDLLLEAFAGEAWKGRRWRLAFYGKGPNLAVLQALAERLGLAECVTFPGFVTPAEIWSRNHVLVMPSRFEGLPLAMVEAMLCGRPVIATDVAGHRELIQDGITGFLAEAPTAHAVGAALERFWARRDEAERIGEAAAQRIREVVPEDPVRVFSDRLGELAGLSHVRAVEQGGTAGLRGAGQAVSL